MSKKEIEGLLTQAILDEGEKNNFSERLFNPGTRNSALSQFSLTEDEKIRLDEILDEVDGLKGLVEACIDRGLIPDWPKPDF